MSDQDVYGNHCERVVFGHEPINPSLYAREIARYRWAALPILPNMRVIEFGCTSGYGTRFLPPGITYTGVDYNGLIIDYARAHFGAPGYTFVHATIDDYLDAHIERLVDPVDVILALEVIEHVPNGREVAQRMKQYATTLRLTTPYREPPGFWGPHHVLHGLSETDFPDFQYRYLYGDGTIHDTPSDKPASLLLLEWTR
jgi:SAM-dependent methyltransferase